MARSWATILPWSSPWLRAVHQTGSVPVSRCESIGPARTMPASPARWPEETTNGVGGGNGGRPACWPYRCEGMVASAWWRVCYAVSEAVITRVGLASMMRVANRQGRQVAVSVACRPVCLRML